MDDQQNINPDEANEQPQESTSDAAAPQARVNGDASADNIPDAIKAAGEQMIGEGSVLGTVPDNAEGDTVDASSINEPSMNFPEETRSEPNIGPAMTAAAQAHPAEFPQFGESSATKIPRNISLLMDVKLPVSIELGRTTLPIGEILEWGQGSIIELDRLAGEPVDLMVNNKLVARGEVVVVDEKFGFRITSLMSPRERLETL